MLPTVGLDIYVPNREGVTGGVARVIEVTLYPGSSGQPVHYVRIAEHPGRLYNWDQDLAGKQCQLKKRFDHQRAHPGEDPPEPDGM